MNSSIDATQARIADRPERAAVAASRRQSPLLDPQRQRRESAKPRLLMCAPAHFEVRYAINPWMFDHIGATSSVQAQTQWTLLRELLGRHARVETIAPVAGLADMVFTANGGFVFGDVFVPSRFRYAQRRGERYQYVRWAIAAGLQVHELPEAIAFEGAGDALFDASRNVIWCASGPRSDAAAAAALGGMFATEVIALTLADARFYHLDTCFCPLPNGTVLWYPPAFTADSRACIEARIGGPARIAVDDKDAMAFACNALGLGGAVVMHRASGALKRRLDERGLTVIETPLGEFLKAGGSARCLTLQLDQDAAAC